MFDAMTAVTVRLQNLWFRARNDEEGQTLVEYGLIIAVVALGSVLALGFLSGKIQTLFSKTGNKLNASTP
jgi:Flp pilus assembly pilin Flp